MSYLNNKLIIKNEVPPWGQINLLYQNDNECVDLDKNLRVKKIFLYN
jgi:hypothetical protein